MKIYSQLKSFRDMGNVKLVNKRLLQYIVTLNYVIYYFFQLDEEHFLKSQEREVWHWNLLYWKSVTNNPCNIFVKIKYMKIWCKIFRPSSFPSGFKIKRRIRASKITWNSLFFSKINFTDSYLSWYLQQIDFLREQWNILTYSFPMHPFSRKVFWCFLGVEKGCFRNDWVKMSNCYCIFYRLYISFYVKSFE